MGLRTRIACLGVGALIGLSAATQIVAWRYHYQPALGWGLVVGKPTPVAVEQNFTQSTNKSRSQKARIQKARAQKTRSSIHAKSPTKLYPPWNFLVWQKKWGQIPAHQNNLRIGLGMLMAGFALGAMMIRLFDTGGSSRSNSLKSGNRHKRRNPSWGTDKELIKAGLGGHDGVILGRIEPPSFTTDWIAWPRLLVSPDLRPVLVTGGTRSGKGRGIVVPTLLNWRFSTLVFDPKGELWVTTSGYRHCLGPTLFFNPRHKATARFNPLSEITTGPECIAQVQRLVAILVAPQGSNHSPDFWDRQGGEMLGALIVHVLHGDGPKSLVEVKRLTANLDETVRAMLSTWHIKDANGQGIVHPYISDIATAYAATHEKGRKSVQMTVRSYLTWLVGADVEYALSDSDFRLGDLMCAKEPVTLYIQIAPGDLKALQPLVRMFFQLASTAFTTHITTDSDGRPKENALLLALDEFPLLGKVDFFEDVVRLASGYGIKCLFIAQSLNDIARVYGTHNGFIDNAHIYVAFAALDPVTREKVSKLTGLTTVTRTSASMPHHYNDRGGSTNIGEYERPLMDVGEVGSLLDAQELVFIAGHKPYLLTKVLYDKIGWMKKRAKMIARDQATGIDTPERPAHPWEQHKPFGYGDPMQIKFCEDVTRERQQAETKAAEAFKTPRRYKYDDRHDAGEKVITLQREMPDEQQLALWRAASEKKARDAETTKKANDDAPEVHVANGHNIKQPTSSEIIASLRSGD
jgi:type IV secretion system protein VirD4